MTKHNMAKWKCLTCGSTSKVTNGRCEKCGPTQTNPVDAEAKKEAGLVETTPQEKDLKDLEQ